MHKIWEWELIFGCAVKAISSPGVRSPCSGKAANVKNISSEIHNSPWKSSVDEKGPMNFFNVNNCMNAWESSNDHKKLKPCPQ